MTEYFVVYDEETGEERWRGQGPSNAAATQVLPEGLAAVVVPVQVIAGTELDLVALRTALAARVDVDAELVRQRFLTPGAGQALTYQRKEAEARAWLADNNLAVTPFLVAEAIARSVPLAQVVGEVVTMADAWIAAGSAIEALRMGAKAALAPAANFGEMFSAATIDWTPVLSLLPSEPEE